MRLFYFLITYGICKKRKYFLIAWVNKKKFSPLDECSCFVWLEHKISKKKFPSGRLSVCPSVRTSFNMSGCLAARTWIRAMDTITFGGVSGSKQNLVVVFYVWNVDLVLKSKVKSRSWSWSWTESWFSQKLCRAAPNLVCIFRI